MYAVIVALARTMAAFDLADRRDAATHVYQVRNTEILTAAALKQAVEHFANPSRVGIGMEEWTQRRFDAVRFVLATGRAVNDTRSGLPGATVAASRPTPR